MPFEKRVDFAHPLSLMADAITPGNAVLEKIGISSSWIMVDHRSFILNSAQQYTINRYDIACILSYSYSAINLPGLFLAGAQFAIVTSNSGGSIKVVSASSETSITVTNGNMSPGYTISVLFYRFPES